jgi:hypothetical protein
MQPRLKAVVISEQLQEPRSGEIFLRRSATHRGRNIETTAFSRGYSLLPLRGWE